MDAVFVVLGLVMAVVVLYAIIESCAREEAELAFRITRSELETERTVRAKTEQMRDELAGHVIDLEAENARLRAALSRQSDPTVYRG